MTLSAEAEPSPRPPASQAGYGFGTFKGVCLPSILTILGVIMFLRLPWVLGSVGLGRTLLIVTLSVAITLLTGLSIAAMATNMRMGGGGAYYMISRTLGLENYAAYYAALSNQTDGLPPTALVNAGEEVDLHRLFAGI